MMRRTLVLLGLFTATPALLAAQQDEAHIAIMAGIADYDMAGVGRTGVYAIRLDTPIYPSVLLELGMSYARPGEFSFADLYIPELQVQLQGTWNRFSPYLGIGGGTSVEVPEPGLGISRDISFAPSFSAGVRTALATGAGFRLEGRMHGIEADFSGTFAELTAGISISW